MLKLNNVPDRPHPWYVMISWARAAKKTILLTLRHSLNAFTEPRPDRTLELLERRSMFRSQSLNYWNICLSLRVTPCRTTVCRLLIFADCSRCHRIGKCISATQSSIWHDRTTGRASLSGYMRCFNWRYKKAKLITKVLGYPLQQKCTACCNWSARLKFA